MQTIMPGPEETKPVPEVKVVVDGDGFIGKTSLIRRFSKGMFLESRVMTSA